MRKNPFEILNGRAMVSLGPLAAKKYCTYSCPFCYVKAGFNSYHRKSVSEIVDWLAQRKSSFDVVYVSGDTDSFAPPRTTEAMGLLHALGRLDCDVLFTTRYVFSDPELQQLGEIARDYQSKSRMLIGCVSVAQLNHPRIEPPPIASPADRISQLARLKLLGIRTVLAVRPFLPHIPTSEYLDIVKAAAAASDVVLGETWYFDQDGILERAVFGESRPQFNYSTHEMDFDSNGKAWKIFEGKETELAMERLCKSLNIPFFMRSAPALEYFRKSAAAK